MADIPEPAVQAAAEVRLRQYGDEWGAHGLSWQDFTSDAREILEAATPLLAEAVAQKITAHMESRGPHKPAGALESVTAIGRDYRAWRRHFGIAARVAAGAFDTGEDQLRKAAETIERGDYVRCDIPEVPGDR